MRNLLSLAAIFFGTLAFAGTSAAVSVDSGKTAYANNCASCHSNPQSYQGVSAGTIQNAIQRNRGGMGRLSALSATDVQDIAAYLSNPNATTVASTGNTQPAVTPAPPAPVTAAATTDSDRIFDWAGSAYPQLFGAHGASQSVGDYYLRHFPGANVYLASKNGQLYFFNANQPGDGLLELGSVSTWLNQLKPAATTGGHDGGDNDGNDGDGNDGGDSDGNDGNDHRGGHDNHHGAGHDDD